ncbi:hypothetical protein EXIGLDRAFT_108449 [Exidia glandulosa HHB12029]|uniref:Uncharacterized protein n=1 Tax=Exidia glandulosa HHB12029 TaxID=1314781 RepID=A0A165GRU3_EXIGL|nr:hypothetical protein EXIGLDRAFT_108449 [Exidia glandulosa HHB12029]
MDSCVPGRWELVGRGEMRVGRGANDALDRRICISRAAPRPNRNLRHLSSYSHLTLPQSMAEGEPGLPKRSRPSLRRRLLNTINDAAQSSGFSLSNSRPVSVLRKKRRDDGLHHPAPRAVSAERYSSSKERLAESLYATSPRHSRFASEPDGPQRRARPDSISTISSSEVFTPFSEHPALFDPTYTFSSGSSPASERRPAIIREVSEARSVHIKQPWLTCSSASLPSTRAPSPATFVTAPSSPDLVAFPQQLDGARPHSSSDYYRLLSHPQSPHLHSHSRCMSDPDAEQRPRHMMSHLLQQRPSQQSLALSDRNRKLPALPPEASTSATGSDNTSDSDGPATPPDSETAHDPARVLHQEDESVEDEVHLLAPGTFSHAASAEEDYPEPDLPHSFQSSRDVVDALRGSGSGSAENEKGAVGEGAAVGRRNSLLARATSLSRATSLKWKNVTRKRRGTTKHAAALEPSLSGHAQPHTVEGSYA